MSKCKRNILLIFGCCLIVAIFFLPVQKMPYHPSGKKYVGNNSVAFFPFFFKELIKYEKFITWKQAIDLKHKEKKHDFINNLIRKLEKEHEKREPSFSEYVKLRVLKKEVESGKADNVKEVKKLIENLNKSREAEFKSKFGNYPYYYKLRVELYIILISIIILAGGFAYILFCGGLRKIRGKMREARRDVIKRRKIGVILILIGIGIPLVFSQFLDRQKYVVILGLEFPFGYAFAIGIILFLIGAGIVIFSFFPKDANPKK